MVDFVSISTICTCTFDILFVLHIFDGHNIFNKDILVLVNIRIAKWHPVH